jgi:aminocarboxymuconate-semialdehyde decarboxylase
MAKHPVEYFRMFHGDTAVNGWAPAIRCGLDFFGPKRVMFGTDCPFDPQGGPLFIRESIRAIDSLNLKAAEREGIYFGNALRMLRMKPPAAAKPARRKKK